MWVRGSVCHSGILEIAVCVAVALSVINLGVSVAGMFVYVRCFQAAPSFSLSISLSLLFCSVGSYRAPSKTALPL